GRIEYFTPNHTEGSDMRELLAVKECEFPSASMRYDARIISEPDLNWFDPAYPALAAEPVTEGGRQAAWFVRCGSHDGVLRRYRRGGLAARVSDDRYIWAGLGQVRSLNEFDVLRSLYEAGLPVPRPFAAAYWRHGL